MEITTIGQLLVVTVSNLAGAHLRTIHTKIWNEMEAKNQKIATIHQFDNDIIIFVLSDKSKPRRNDVVRREKLRMVYLLYAEEEAYRYAVT